MGSLPRIALLAVSIGALTAIAPAASAGTRPCIPGEKAPLCHSLSGKVVSVGDGDTIDVNIAGDGTRRHSRVRITGIQSMELRRYSSIASRRRGACHSREATRRMEQLVLHRRVRLLSQKANSTGKSGRRLRRSVLVRRGGRWIDPAKVLVAEGHALWLANNVEWAWNRDYRNLSLEAAANGRRLFDRSYCGAGPGAADALGMSVRWDAPGDDRANVRGEYARVKNVGRRPIRLGGWRFRDSALRHYTLPRGTRIRPGAALTIHVGRGSRRAGHLFWGLSTPAFENPTFDRRGRGDGAYLFDRQGDLRAWSIYPCGGCGQPRSRPDRDEPSGRGNGKGKGNGHGKGRDGDERDRDEDDDEDDRDD